jgi:hypothetical protein
MVVVLHRQAEQFIAHRAAYDISFHLKLYGNGQHSTENCGWWHLDMSFPRRRDDMLGANRNI